MGKVSSGVQESATGHGFNSCPISCAAMGQQASARGASVIDLRACAESQAWWLLLPYASAVPKAWRCTCMAPPSRSGCDQTAHLP